MYELLNKYKKIKLDPKRVKELKHINTLLKLKYNPTKIHDYLILSVYETGLNNKTYFETTFESIRNEHIDMWDYIQFQERNLIVHKMIEDTLQTIPQFRYNDETIYIPFFTPLLNSLYGTQTAILELPQFFKLYTKFTQDVESIFKYQLQSFIHNMSEYTYIAGNDPIILYKEGIFVVFKEVSCITYPLNAYDTLSEKDIAHLGKLLLQEDVQEFIKFCIEHELLSPKCIKKITKKYKKMEVSL